MLTDDGHARHSYEATGAPELSFADGVEELAEATGRRIRYMRASTERYATLLAGQDVPEEVVVRLRRVIDKLVDGRNGTAEPQRRARDRTSAARLRRLRTASGVDPEASDSDSRSAARPKRSASARISNASACAKGIDCCNPDRGA